MKLKLLYKGLAVGIIALFVVAMIPLTQAAAPPKTPTPTLKVVTGSALKVLKAGDGVLYLDVPAGKMIKLKVTFWVQKSFSGDWTNKELDFSAPIGVGPDVYGSTTISYRSYEYWFLQDVSYSELTFEVLANTSCAPAAMPLFSIDWQSTSMPEAISVYALWWAEYYE